MIHSVNSPLPSALSHHRTGGQGDLCGLRALGFILSFLRSEVPSVFEILIPYSAAHLLIISIPVRSSEKTIFPPSPRAIVCYFPKSRVNVWPGPGLPVLLWDEKDAGLAVCVKAWPTDHWASALLGARSVLMSGLPPVILRDDNDKATHSWGS